VLVWGARAVELGYRATNALAIPAIALGVYITGGATSPLLPLVFLSVALAAYFATPRGAVLRLLAMIAVCASPFLYSGADAQLLFILRFVALAATAGVLVGIILYNRRELAQAEQVSRELASHDPLTGLPNRRAFADAVERTLKDAGPEVGSPMSIAMIDLDNFKRVNDMFGHATGDVVLREAARRLQKLVRASDVVARVGGDEFTCVLFGADETAGAETAARIVHAVVNTPHRYLHPSVSIGVAAAEPGTPLDPCLRAADAALYRAKHTGGRRHILATASPSMGAPLAAA
jgi:diguanylate cyclase (GGDEF)-like protein